MGILIILIIVLSCPADVLSHPGKTDRYGGHKCWKGCGEWELLHGEYHLHDDDFRPLKMHAPGRGVRKEQPKREVILEEIPAVESTAPPIQPPEPAVRSEPATHALSVTEIHKVPGPTVYEEDLLITDALLLVALAALLFLLLIALRRRKKTSVHP